MASTAFAPSFPLPANTELKATPLSPAIGAIVESVDLSHPLSPSQKNNIHQLLLRHQVLFFRKQTISPAQQRDFARNFGKLHLHPIFPTVPDVPEAIVLDTAKNDLRDNALWHTDVTFQQEPPMGAVLTSRLLPETGGGDTLWASGTAAYDALSDGMKQRIDTLTAQHDFLRSFPVSRYGRTEAELEKWAETRNNFPPVTHPVVRIHPETGAKALFVNEGFTTEINDIDPEESAALLSYLTRHATRPEFSIRWRWEEGDVAFWDNRITQHYAVNDYLPARRIMNRVTIIGDRPYGPTRQEG
ncbi:taurine dioxygenase [Bombella sp. TMW 2.2543]|uniref:Taurine dioxygenase n=1 Tax=Bombella pluederhausensis TaxID=2967336 RepID=A0ABT3WHY1_9PROT|nr:taurine dioxygenase [Bombella pluederhausensis]MCX5618682.1 taurine dioxygenase [Bombella pluederhausensis]